jgi:hypothetical protein
LGSGTGSECRQLVFGEAHALWQDDGETVEECGLDGIGLGDAAQADLALAETTCLAWGLGRRAGLARSKHSHLGRLSWWPLTYLARAWRQRRRFLANVRPPINGRPGYPALAISRMRTVSVWRPSYCSSMSLTNRSFPLGGIHCQ